MITGKSEIECPFCHKTGVKAFHKPSYLQGSKSSISAGSKTTFHRVPESYKVQGSCPNCGKSEREIQDEFDGKPRKPDPEKLKERFKRSGLPTTMEFEVR